MKVKELVRKLSSLNDINEYDVIFINNNKLTRGYCIPVIFDDEKQIYLRFVEDINNEK